MRVLLFGASGFIGSHLLNALLAKNIPVAVVLRKESKPWRIQSQLMRVTVIQQDFSTLDKAFPEIIKFAPDTLINLAWYGVENKYCNDDVQFIQNLTLTQSLFDLAKNTGIRAFIGIGSQAEYGPHHAKLDESAAVCPSTLYGVAKLSAYHLLRVLCEKANIRFVWLRVFSTYGPKDNPEWFVPYLIGRLLKGEVPQLTLGEQQWDYLYVEDAARAIMAAALDDKATGVFNLGSGKINSVRTLAEMVRDLINPELLLDFGAVPYRKDQVMHLQADITRLKNILNWTPEVELKVGIEKTIRWLKSHG